MIERRNFPLTAQGPLSLVMALIPLKAR